MAKVHSTAIVAPGAELDAECEVGAYSVIGPMVRIGRGTTIGPHVVVEGRTTIGEANMIFQFASVGAVPQDLKYRGEPSELIIGSRNIIREYVTLQPGTEGGGMKTVIGNGNLFMACSHVGHDGIIGDECVFANSCAMAGHVTVGNRVTVGGMAGLHQFIRLGDLCIVGAGSMVSEDIPPYTMAQGDRAHLAGLNVIGLQRAGIAGDDIAGLKRVFRTVFLGSGRFSERLAAAAAQSENSPTAKALLAFLASGSKRGITPARRRRREADAENSNE